jgi:cell wall-associated NlpC family hydrolase
VRFRGVAAAAIVALVCAGCGSSRTDSGPQNSQQHFSGPSMPNSPALHAHPQAVEPVAGAAAQESAGSSGPAVVSVDNSNALPQPVSDAQVKRELAQSGLAAKANHATLTTNGLAIAPANAPLAVQEIVQAGNQIAHLPYVWGGGHAKFIDTGYDCSGSLSFVFAAAGILKSSMVSGDLANWGAPGPGKWVTVFANNGHTFMYVAGLRFDTVALAQTGSRWSNRAANESNLGSYAIRHPPGL